MRSLLVVLAVVGVAVARPGHLGFLGRNLLHAPVAYSTVAAAPLVRSTIVAPAPVAYAGHLGVSSQYHAQDELGQYSYGYAGGPSAKSEVKTFDGVTRGGYSYVDAEGKVQNVNYVADGLGFRVAATNLPVAPQPIPAEPLIAPAPVEDTVEVASAKAAHFAAHAEAKAAAEAAPEIPVAVERAVVATPAVIAAPAVATPFAYSAPIAAPFVHSTVVAPAPVLRTAVVAPTPIFRSAVVAPAPIAYAGHLGVSSQYHAQDELGQYSYGYAGGPSAKSELKTFDGVTRGGYSYVDAEGKIQNVNYVADALGFRVAATNLPVAPVAGPAPVLETIPDTVEVAAARAAHFAAHEEAKARLVA
ncbi:hypothetical protein J437_LFUL016524 [Ladona fulva]|uniref:Cuticle protein 6 n=1 Tax=Ladona fulva TaxID=123851 RepID=A0A8K0KLE9_LADFU|nr:hypothetical protein J437_LFUL016524 [Ladona fulva]